MLKKAFKTNINSVLLFNKQPKRLFSSDRDDILIETGDLDNMLQLNEPTLKILNTTQYANEAAKEDHIQARISLNT